MRRVGAAVLIMVMALVAWWLLGDGQTRVDMVDVPDDAKPKAEAPPPMLEARGPQPAEDGVADAGPASAGAKPTPKPETQPTRYTIHGRIVGKDPATPVPRGEVVASIDAWRVEDGRPRHTQRSYRAPIDRAGRFTLVIEGRPPEPVSHFALDGADVRVERWYIENRGSEPAPRGLPRIREGIDNRPDAVTHVVLVLVPTFRLRGTVVDEHGTRLKHVQITSMRLSHGPGGADVVPHAVHTDEDGAFDIGPFDVEPPEDGSMLEALQRVSFRHPGFSLLRLDPWSVAPRDREDLRIVLERGIALAGSLVDPEGRPLPGVLVEFEYGNDAQLRKATRTDERGLWSVEDLPRGTARVRALAFAHGCKVRRDIEVEQDDHRVDLVAEPVPRPDASKTHAVLGLTLAEVDDELRKAYELPEHVHILILDVPEDHERLGIGTLEPGYGLWKVGHAEVVTLAEAVTRLVTLSDGNRAPIRRMGPTVRVVYTFANEFMRGTNTQHVRVTDEDRKALEALAARLPDR